MQALEVDWDSKAAMVGQKKPRRCCRPGRSTDATMHYEIYRTSKIKPQSNWGQPNLCGVDGKDGKVIGWRVLIIEERQPSPSESTAEDTATLVQDLISSNVDAILYAGGDGTTRDIVNALDGNETPLIGVPAGVKMHSGCFATRQMLLLKFFCPFFKATCLLPLPKSWIWMKRYTNKESGRSGCMERHGRRRVHASCREPKNK